jgi:hypothetical protein
MRIRRHIYMLICRLIAEVEVQVDFVALAA